MGSQRILLVDDDAVVLNALTAILEQHGFEVSPASDVSGALELISRQRFDVLLSDLNIGQPGDGFTVVSAMRRVQPEAAAFILTGYPDFESAMTAIRNQVDDYFSKPIEVTKLLDAIRNVSEGRNSINASPPMTVATLLRQQTECICEEWLKEVLRDPEIAAIPLADEERKDHLPALIDRLGSCLEQRSSVLTDDAVEAARKHGITRHQQGYTIPQIIGEARVLQSVLSSTIQQSLLQVDLSSLAPDVLRLGHDLQAEVEVSVRAYQAQVPHSLQTSLSILYRSPYLGIAILRESTVVDCNEAFLRITGRTREEVASEQSLWSAMSPDPAGVTEVAALEQLRDFGACAPYEKVFSPPDRGTVPCLVGAVRLNPEPLEWSAYVLDLSEQRKILEAEQKVRELESKNMVVNQLAHELNNPLAALVFSTHLLSSHAALTDDMRSHLKDIVDMLSRISNIVRTVLLESSSKRQS